MDLPSLTIKEAYDAIKSRKISSKELTTAVLERIGKIEPKVDSYITLTKDLALRQAEAADEIISTGQEL